MIRRLLSWLFGTVAIAAAMLTATGWVTASTVGNPNRTGRIAHELLQSSAVRNELISTISGEATSLGLDLTSAQTLATTALNDKRLSETIEDSVVAAHKDVLEGSDLAELHLDGAVLYAVLQDAAAKSGVDASLVPNPGSLNIPIPMSWVVQKTWRIARWWPTAALLCAASIGAALLIGNPRSTVFKRLGRWFLVTPLAYLVGYFAIRFAVEKMNNGWSDMVWRVMSTVTREVVTSASVMFSLGAALLVAGVATSKAEQVARK